MLGMSKRGDAYLRTLLIHGARSAIWAAKNKADNTQGWLTNLLKRRHPNVAAVALANTVHDRQQWGSNTQPVVLSTRHAKPNDKRGKCSANGGRLIDPGKVTRVFDSVPHYVFARELGVVPEALLDNSIVGSAQNQCWQVLRPPLQFIGMVEMPIRPLDGC
jgi:hypothetical protein